MIKYFLLRGVLFITILLHFSYFIPLETANTQKREVFLLRIRLGNVNASVVTCRFQTRTFRNTL